MRNALVCVEQKHIDILTLRKLCRHAEALPCAHTIRFSFKKAIDVLRWFEGAYRTLSRVACFMKNLIAFLRGMGSTRVFGMEYSAKPSAKRFPL